MAQLANLLHTYLASHPSLRRVKGNHHASTCPTNSTLVTQTVIKSTSLASLVKFSPSSSTSSDMKHPICSKNHMSRLLCPITSSPGHATVSTSLCLGMVRLHPQPCCPKQEKSHAQVISSCCNLSIRTILQTKASPQLTSFRQVTSLQLNICDECGQHTHTPQNVPTNYPKFSK
jgi:hypothetical protein